MATKRAQTTDNKVHPKKVAQTTAKPVQPKKEAQTAAKAVQPKKGAQTTTKAGQPKKKARTRRHRLTGPTKKIGVTFAIDLLGRIDSHAAHLGVTRAALLSISASMFMDNLLEGRSDERDSHRSSDRHAAV